LHVDVFLANLARQEADFDFTHDEFGVTVFFRPDDQEHPSGTHFTWDAIKQNDWGRLQGEAKAGRDVTHITRVTGYMSKTSGWNAGKQAELKDRFRSGV